MQARNNKLPPDIRAFLKRSKLSYVTDTARGITRQRRGKNFIYKDDKGRVVKDAATLERIRHLAIPPAYRDVWICPKASGHLQAVGYDARGRKQYRYHEKWRELRDADKFEHILKFGEKLPALRRRVARDIKKKGLSLDKVMAAVVDLLEKTLIRVGNDEYARNNHSYGLTTLRSKHVHIHGAEIDFAFPGKSGKLWKLKISDRRLAKIMRHCDALPGYELFKYVDDKGAVHDVTSSHVNHYLQQVTGENFTAKDFRTWFGTVLAAVALLEFEKYDSAAQAKKNVMSAIEHVAKQLGNTRAICRKCYIHPEILESYLTGDFLTAAAQRIDEKFTRHYRELTTEEVMVLAFLKKRLKKKRSSKK